MYPDPKRIRENRVTVRLDDYENDLVIALANYRGDAPSTMLREMVLREALAVLSVEESVARAAG